MSTLAEERRVESAEMTPEIEPPTMEELFGWVDIVREAGVGSPLIETRRTANGTLEFKDFRFDKNTPGGSFKDRGAYLAIRKAYTERGITSFVAASAGNHASGVGNAVKTLKEKGVDAEALIIMAKDTPTVKVDKVKSLGGEAVKIDNTTFDTFGQASDEAEMLGLQEGVEYIPPYNSRDVIEGQATASFEALMACFNETTGTIDADVAYLTAGGAGCVAGTLLTVSRLKREGYLKSSFKVVVGIMEGNDSLLQTANNNWQITPATKVDTFTEGAAVEEPGPIPVSIIEPLADENLEFEVVTKDEMAAEFAAFERRNGRRIERGLTPLDPPETTALVTHTAASKRAKRYEGEPQIWLTFTTGGNVDEGKLSQLRFLHRYNKAMEEEVGHQEETVSEVGRRTLVLGGLIGAR